tara:strand:- start:510 stop:1382 length:873 start_codon:yes stop_codon:yes gene_type:complete
MIKIIILIPVFNDWESLKKLIFEINENIKHIKNTIFECIIVNDASTIPHGEIKKPIFIKSIKILNMKKNRGHARCNAFGIRYAVKNERFDYLILMDGDGEDRPEEIKTLINQALKYKNNSVVAKRIKRSEGIFFKFLYVVHKLITLLFTGKKIYFGNYSCLTRKNVEKISNISSLWSSYSGTLKKNIKELKEINSIRGLRYFGPSKMSLINLVIHSFSIIAVFKLYVLLRSILMIIILFPLLNYNELLFFLFVFFLTVFNLLIFIVSKRENYGDMINSQNNLKDTTYITH